MTKRAGSTVRPVFLDSTGTRRRFFTLFGVVVGVLLTITTAMLAAGFVGGGSGVLPGLPGLSRPGLSRPGPAAGQTPAPGGTPPHASTPPTARPTASPNLTAAPAPSGTGVASPVTTTTAPVHRNIAHPTPSHGK
jgi:hypothetical protein